MRPDPITAEVEGLFDDIDSVDLRAKLQRKTRKLSPLCRECGGLGEHFEPASNGDGRWMPCETCHPKKVL